MKWIKSSVYFAVLSILCLDVLPISSLNAQVKAESISKTQGWQISQAFKPPKRGDPPASAGGSTRGSSCLKNKKQIVPLLPANKLGLTLAERPTLFWFVPESSVKTAKFVLLTDKDENSVYETTLTLPNKSGIISFTLPKTAPELAVGKTYHWYLTVMCNSQDASTNPWVDGWVERTEAEASLSAALAKAQPRKLPSIYAEAGIWYEALATSAQLRRSEPKNVRARVDWWTLLKSVNLNALASEPFVDCCKSD
ncbi:DUF928 domain-containing protein [Nostoc sp. FACHB-87]|uniref:DUF928 domain-containing protein n=1 Tax=Nostocaceae TaxID=1162 RepID=UPI0016855DCA|nr:MULTISPECIES: DUF928 domain-containing protein [Nostocaceae]MBD2458158.1 DUF928 domain-containing protein [Nostoc sp. FACHB-87]MBD2478980.1 DUF928 domain-containing protein [Anabaena sp. FACHB-83]